MQSKAKTVDQYLEELPIERKSMIETVRNTILENLPAGIAEVMNWGMICYQVPLAVYPDTCNKQPLMFAALASQKNHCAVYLTNIYADEDRASGFEKAYRATGKRYDVGKSCVRFRKLDDLPLELIGRTIAAQSMKEFIAVYEAARAATRKR